MQQSIDTASNKVYSRKEQLYFLFIAFAIGIAITAIEKTITRLLIPYIGSTLYTDVGFTSAMMFCLAIGYYLGANQAEKQANLQFLCKLLGGIGAYVSLLALWAFAGARLFASSITIHPFRILLTSWGSTLLLIGLPSILAGMVITYLIQLSAIQQPEKTARGIGKIIAWAAIGSMGGGALSTFIALPFLGIQKTIFYTGCFLLIVALISFVTIRLKDHLTARK